ncbi:MAG: isoprenylcysteine carboxylmethyltransferase family protein [Bacteroidales bacterium]|nr:isoprenylcysteine carboxylmethyltransferase family protein [Bacteroidales bacterium]
MNTFTKVLKYTLEGIVFVVVLPYLMWILSRRPALLPIDALQLFAALLLITKGLVLNLCAVMYKRHKLKEYKIDEYGHSEKRRVILMTKGPYKICRNPMLTGAIEYLLGYCIGLGTWQSYAVIVAFIAVALIKINSEERRLLHVFGDEYAYYCYRTGRFTPFSLQK